MTSRIVNDLIPTILETNDDHWWPRDLQRLALVSPAWVGPIRRRLYAYPAIRSFRACAQLARTLSSNPSIQSLVRGVDIRPARDANGGLTIMEINMAGLRYILGVPGLQSITIGGCLAIHAERFLHMLINPRYVSYLHIVGQEPSSDTFSLQSNQLPSLEWDEGIAFKFPKLRTLRLSNLTLSIAPPSLPCPLRITDITLEDVTIISGVLQDMCNESWDSVRNLSITAKTPVEPDEHLRWTLECCENLEHFHFEQRGSSRRGAIFDEDFPPLPSLRRLCLLDIDVNSQSLVTISQSCGGLETLSVSGRTVRISPDDWSSFIHSGALSSLQSLNTSPGTNVPPFTYWSKEMRQQVADACASRGITLVGGVA